MKKKLKITKYEATQYRRHYDNVWEARIADALRREAGRQTEAYNLSQAARKRFLADHKEATFINNLIDKGEYDVSRAQA